MQRQIALLAAEWQNAKQDASFLLRGSRLEQFGHWARNTKLELTFTEHTYLNTSMARREQEIKAEAEHQAREARLERRSRDFLRGLVAVLLVATLGAFGLTGFALSERSQAQANFALSESQRLAAEANLLLANDRSNEVAALVSIHALQSAYSPQADMALQRASRQNFGERIILTPTDISSVAFSPDGSSILMALYGGTVQLYDVQSGGVRWEATQFTGAPWVSISPDNRYALVTDERGHLLDLATGEEVRQFTDPSSGWVGAAVFSPDGRSILAAGEGSSWIEDIHTGEVIREFAGTALDAQFSPDGGTVATLNADGIVRLWDARNGQEIRQWSVPSTDEIVFSPDGRYLATSADDKTARLWDVESGEQIQEFVGHLEVVNALAFSPDGRYLATGSMDSSARLWDIATGLEVRRFAAHRYPLFTIAFSPDGRYLLTGSRDASARLWDLQAPAEPTVLIGTPGFSYGIVYSPDLRYLATASAGDINLWDNATRQHLGTFSVPGGYIAVRGITFSPDSHYLLATDMTNQLVHLFDVQSGKTLHVWNGGALNGSAIFTPDGREALVSTPTGMYFYDVETGEQVRSITTEQGNQYLTYSPDHRYLISSGPITAAQEAYLWDARTGELLRPFTGLTRDITSMTFTPDGRYVVAGSDDKVVVFWDVETGEVRQRLTGHTARIYALAFSADGRTLLTGSLDGTARLWDWQSGRELRRFVGQGMISSAVFSPDEQFVLIGSSDGKVYITPTRIEELVQSVCRRVLRDLTADERVQYIVRSEAPTCTNPAR